MDDELISVIDAARELGRSKQTVFKVLRRLDIETRKERRTAHGGQQISFITADDLRRVRYALSPAETGNRSGEIPAHNDNETGVFYLIQLEPEHDDGRFKVGYATNLKERLRQHRCSAPFAAVLATWPCKPLWERTAIDCVTVGCEQIHTEVFRCDDLDKIKKRCDSFFALMPSLSAGV